MPCLHGQSLDEKNHQDDSRDSAMKLGAGRIGTLFAPAFISGWIVIPAVRSVQNSPDFIYLSWLDVANE